MTFQIRTKPLSMFIALIAVTVIFLSSFPSLLKAAEDIFDTGVRVYRGLSADTEFEPATLAPAEEQSAQPAEEQLASESSPDEPATEESSPGKDCEGVRVHRTASSRKSRIRQHRAGTRSRHDWYNVPTHRMGERKPTKIKTHRMGERKRTKIKTHRMGGGTGRSKIKTHKTGKRTRTCYVN